MAAITSKTLRRSLKALALTAGVTALAGSALAQGVYGPPPGYGDPAASPLDDVTVFAPRSYRRAPTGAPIRDVAISRVVYTGDLDLRSSWGRNALESRVRQAARSACSEMDAFHPIATADSPPCVQTAMRDAFYQVNARLGGGW